jgi:hypothetical protein
MLNEMNNKLMHDKLFAMQESIKAKKGIKNKTKELESFARGGDNTPAGYNAAGFMMDPRFAGEISMGVSAPTPRVRDTWGMKGDVTAPWDNYGRVSEVNAGTLPEVTITAPKRTKETTVTKRSTSINGPTVQLPEDYVENPYENWAPSKIVTKPQIKGNGILDNFLMTPSEVEADIARR